LNIYIIADTHFNHQNIIWFAHRPFKDVEDMNKTMIKNWNDTVNDDDLIIHLGDFVYGGIKKIKEIKNQLNGIMMLIKGNHDKMYRMRACNINTVKQFIVIKNLFLTHEPAQAPNGFVNVHGHTHTWNSWNGINACVEQTNYKPVNIKEYYIKAKELLGGGECLQGEK